ncbi:hypothetical protein ACOTTU_20080 [Roseobacter sp. EG26]|uniref:hypothetical protein n=1 Tax=Roseobacter sp. EG26 TaxID=3412477 RepID=UPI00260C6867|nr:hypothetical protein [uncultured Roseobacter sp.]
MASTSLADYQVLMDGSKTVEYDLTNPTYPRAIDDTFIWPSDLHISSGARRPILMFNIRPYTDVEFDVFLNTRFIAVDMDFNASHTRSHSEVFSFSSPLAAGIPNNNRVAFRINMKKGRARFSDIVIWYQINR